MTQRKKRLASVMMGVTLAGGMVLAGQPALAQQAENRPTRDVKVGYPLGGEHTMRVSSWSVCHWPGGKGSSPVQQSLVANAWDVDANYSPENFFDIDAYFPFNSGTVKWENTKTGATGTATKRSNGVEIDVGDIDTGIGDVKVTFTVTRSLLPIILEDFPLSSALSHSRTETFFVKGIDPVACEAAPG